VSVNELIVIVGPTASGKTVLAVELAERVRGEVVSADAFAVYRGLDLGTAKPDPAMVAARVQHHLLDIADPRERYSAGRFVRDADAAIASIRSRGRIAVVVGGTNFYVRALLHGLFNEPRKDEALRRQLEHAWAANPLAVRTQLVALDPDAAQRIAAGDKQRTLRALEVFHTTGTPMTELWRQSPPARRYAALMLGVRRARTELRARIETRVERMFAAGLVDEVCRLLQDGVPPTAHALKAIGYRECVALLAGEMTEPEAVARTIVATRQLSKRQSSWLRSEREVEWLAGSGDGLVAAAVARVEGHRGPGTGPG
jgi:tRNA dimethylallyltransferase